MILHINAHLLTNPSSSPPQMQWFMAGGASGRRGRRVLAAWTVGTVRGPDTGPVTTQPRPRGDASVTETRSSGRTAPSPVKVSYLVFNFQI